MLPSSVLNLSRTGLFAGLLAAAVALAVPAARADDSSIVLQGQQGWLFPGWGSLTEVDSRGIEASTALIKDAQQALAARGVQLQVLVLPDKTRFYQDKLPAGKALSAQVQQRYQTILASLHKAGISAIDDEAVLRQVKGSGQEVFYRTDQHWTQAAADATAVATAEQAKRDVPALKGSAGSGMVLGSEFKERRFGDLAERFLTPEQRKQTGRETFTVRRQAAANGLLDDAPAPLHVTGHSMVQPYFGFPQKLSNSIDRPVSVNWKPGNVGQWIMLLEYLESPDFKRNPPQVLVWQMFEPTYAQGPQASGLWDNASIMSADAWRQRLRAASGK
ncbi:alginate O-acetyltransferase AlgX-related protein [Pseudomonas xanthosomatis]|uniref:alginate O-acetyltransferase AlgX-related protein n=1 Tax=Pseudomonas xanthosomatis TaxID=2842356 RepID=UPI003519766E